MTEHIQFNQMPTNQTEQAAQEPPQCHQHLQIIDKLKNHQFYQKIKKNQLNRYETLKKTNQPKIINQKMQNRLKKWLQEIGIQTFHFSPTTVIHSFQILSKYLQRTNQHYSQLQLIGCSALYISSKINEPKIVGGECYVQCSNSLFTTKQLQEKQHQILKILEYKLNFRNIINLMRFFNKGYKYSEKLMKQAQKFVIRCYFDEKIQQLSQIIIASSIITSIKSDRIQEQICFRKMLQSFTL